LGLEDGGAVAFRQTNVAAGTGAVAARAVGAAGTIPIALTSGALRGRSALPLTLSGLLALALTLPLSRLLALTLGHLRTETGLRESQCGERLFERF